MRKKSRQWFVEKDKKKEERNRIEERCDEMSAIYKLTSILLLKKDTNKINAFQ